MPDLPPLRVLFFDVFGTCVAQRDPVADELWNATQDALRNDESTINSDVRKKAAERTYDQWVDFGCKWNSESDKFVKENISAHNAVNWPAIDEHRIHLLPKLLSDHGLVLLNETSSIEEGSLFTASQLAHLGRIWHRLPPWPDTCRGLNLLNTRFSTAALSNADKDVLENLVSHSSIPFTHVFSADMFDSFKPSPKVYLGAAERLGVQPEECALVAAHLGDLKAAKACGFYAIYVERELEEKAPELKGEGIPDLVIGEGEEGFVALAGRLGIEIE